MLKVYSKGCEYALRLLSEIPADKLEGKFLARDLSRKAKVPIPSARKVLQALVESGYLLAVSGPGGGYKFSRSPQDITVFDIVTAIDGEEGYSRCVMGMQTCDDRSPCAIHQLWKKVKSEMLTGMSQITILQFMEARERGRS